MASDAAMEVTIDVVGNTVEFRHEAGAELSQAEAAVVQDADGLGAIVNVDDTLTSDDLVVDQLGCNTGLPTGCDPSLRGGTHIRSATVIDGSRPVCTGGFVVQSRLDSVRYLMTAGHCFDRTTGAWDARMKDGTYRRMGNVHRGAENRWFNEGIDAAILNVSQTNWNPRGLVYVRASTDPDPSLGTNRDEKYAFIGTGFAQTNSVVCTTGAISGTDCGRVVNPQTAARSTNALGSFTATELTEVDNLCTKGGDSGGPYYKLGRAYGIHHGTFEGTGCNGRLYTHISDALNHNNVGIVLNGG